MLAHRNEYLKNILSYLCNWMTVSIKIEVIASSAGSPSFFHLAIAIIASRTGEGFSLHISIIVTGSIFQTIMVSALTLLVL